MHEAEIGAMVALRATCWILAGALLASAPVATANPRETVLSRMGVDEALQQRIEGAIRKGVAYLASHQRADGSLGQGGSALIEESSRARGVTALGALALESAGLEPARERAERAARYLARWEAPTTRRGQVVDDRKVFSYSAALELELLARLRFDEPRQAAFCAALRAGQSKRGWWGYDLRLSESSSATDLSCSYFAGHALAACACPAGRRSWQRLAAALTKAQDSQGSWSYHGGRARFYPQGRFMGLGLCLLAASKLKAKSEARTRRSLIRSMEAAREGLAGEVRWFLDSIASLRAGTGGQSVRYPYVSLFIMGETCALVGPTADGIEWYREGAALLVETQRADGSWPTLHGNQSTNGNLGIERTALAVLFLSRGPANVDLPASPTTPGGDDRPR